MRKENSAKYFIEQINYYLQNTNPFSWGHYLPNGGSEAAFNLFSALCAKLNNLDFKNEFYILLIEAKLKDPVLTLFIICAMTHHAVDREKLDLGGYKKHESMRELFLLSQMQHINNCFPNIEYFNYLKLIIDAELSQDQFITSTSSELFMPFCIVLYSEMAINFEHYFTINSSVTVSDFKKRLEEIGFYRLSALITNKRLLKFYNLLQPALKVDPEKAGPEKKLGGNITGSNCSPTSANAVAFFTSTNTDLTDVRHDLNVIKSIIENMRKRGEENDRSASAFFANCGSIIEGLKKREQESAMLTLK